MSERQEKNVAEKVHRTLTLTWGIQMLFVQKLSGGCAKRGTN